MLRAGSVVPAFRCLLDCVLCDSSDTPPRPLYTRMSAVTHHPVRPLFQFPLPHMGERARVRGYLSIPVIPDTDRESHLCCHPPTLSDKCTEHIPLRICLMSERKNPPYPFLYERRELNNKRREARQSNLGNTTFPLWKRGTIPTNRRNWSMLINSKEIP